MRTTAFGTQLVDIQRLLSLAGAMRTGLVDRGARSIVMLLPLAGAMSTYRSGLGCADPLDLATPRRGDEDIRSSGSSSGRSAAALAGAMRTAGVWADMRDGKPLLPLAGAVRTKNKRPRW
ncbi:hypothetical protein AN219_22710 [Streptomyces nanshensis]|nr:hypothetical protein AN219_22710 [Streptomyces nanshensis]